MLFGYWNVLCREVAGGSSVAEHDTMNRLRRSFIRYIVDNVGCGDASSRYVANVCTSVNTYGVRAMKNARTLPSALSTLEHAGDYKNARWVSISTCASSSSKQIVPVPKKDRPVSKEESSGTATPHSSSHAPEHNVTSRMPPFLDTE